MEVIAKTSDGVLIKATEEEVKEMVNSVTGTKPDKIEIGQRVPAIDYATTIRKVKTLKDNSYFKEIFRQHEAFSKSLDALKKSVETAATIEI